MKQFIAGLLLIIITTITVIVVGCDDITITPGNTTELPVGIYDESSYNNAVYDD